MPDETALNLTCVYIKHSRNLYTGQTNKRAFKKCTAFGWCMAVSFANIYNKYQYNVRFRGIPIRVLARNTETSLSMVLLCKCYLFETTLFMDYEFRKNNLFF